jgi:hypothetical protein
MQVHSGNADPAAGRERNGRKTAVLTLVAISLTLLVGGCVCRPVHVSGDPPTTTAQLKASLPY